MKYSPFRVFLACFAVVAMCMGANGGNGGCQPEGPLPGSGLEGLWAIQRGKVELTLNWTVAGGGQAQTETQASSLEPLDPTEFPDELAPLIDQWNQGLAELNASLDKAIPAEVVVAFPSYAVIRITDPAIPTNTGQGAIDSAYQYLLIGDLSGEASGSDQGAGATLGVSTIAGSFDAAALTTQGEVARTLAVILLGPNENGLGLSVQIKASFTGARIGDAPPLPEPEDTTATG